MPLIPPTSPAPTDTLPYVRAFDGVRALAVGLVLMVHWPLRHFTLPLGWAGVNLFFVLSGLLITRILVESRGADDHRRPLADYLRHFYARRTLRIFPLYYGYLLLIGGAGLAWVAASVGRAGVVFWQTDALLLLTYLQNWRDAILGLSQPDNSDYSRWFGHLWSLAVEEQFYLLYPLVVWLVPRHRLQPALWAVLIGAPLLRLGAGEWLRHRPDVYLGRAGWLLSAATPSQLDALALGGLLALGVGRGLHQPGRWLLVAGAVALAWNLAHWLALRHFHSHELPPLSSLGFDAPLRQYRYAPPDVVWLRIRWTFTFSIVNGLSALLLLWAARSGPLIRRLFENRPMVYAGRISYGIYVWHFAPVHLVSAPTVASWVGSSTAREAVALAVYLGCVGLIASASYYGFEQFFLRLKARF